MLDRPYLFAAVNVAIYVLLLSVLGFHIAPYIACVLAVFVFLYNLRFVDVPSSLCLSILYLLVFDSAAFTFTDFKIRMWYLSLLFLIPYYLTRRFSLKNNTIVFLFLISVLFLFSCYYLLVDDFTFKLHIIKYWVFSIGLIYVLSQFFKRTNHPVLILGYLLSVILFVAIYGLVQYVYNTRGNFNLINTHGNIRPEAFFSETTWYAEYLILGFFVVYLLIRIEKRQLYFFFFPLFLLALLISATRNAFLGLVVLVFFESVFFLLLKKVKPRVTTSGLFVFMVFVCVGIGVIVNYSDTIVDQVVVVVNRFDIKNDASGRGRIDAFKTSFDMMRATPAFGHGFYWTEDVVSGVGNSAVGAKSFNLIFMIYHIFGPVGFTFFAGIVLLYFYLLMASIFRSPNLFLRCAFYVFLIFFMMSMFAPMHQYPIGMLFVAFSIFLYKLGLNEKYLLNTTEY